MKEFYITDDGIQLHAKLDMPEEKEKCPLVIVFHGLTGNMEERHITAFAGGSGPGGRGVSDGARSWIGHGRSFGADRQRRAVGHCHVSGKRQAQSQGRGHETRCFQSSRS